MKAFLNYLLGFKVVVCFVILILPFALSFFISDPFI